MNCKFCTIEEAEVMKGEESIVIEENWGLVLWKTFINVRQSLFFSTAQGTSLQYFLFWSGCRDHVRCIYYWFCLVEKEWIRWPLEI